MESLCLKTELENNSYPGRGIVLGMSPCGKKAVIAYFIMGRSVNSRNRVFVPEERGLRTQAYDPALLSDPSLVIYAPVRVVGSKTIVTNGDQTDTVRDFLLKGQTFEDALRTRSFEPDAPNFTPRISGEVTTGAGSFTYKLSILKSTQGNPAATQRAFFEYQGMAGLGHFLHTYKCDGNPRIPSFEGEPEPVAIQGEIEAFTHTLWTALNDENKVSLFTRFIDLETGVEESRILNKNQ